MQGQQIKQIAAFRITVAKAIAGSSPFGNLFEFCHSQSEKDKYGEWMAEMGNDTVRTSPWPPTHTEATGSP